MGRKWCTQADILFSIDLMLQMPGQHSSALVESFPGATSKLLAIAFAVNVIWSALDRPESPLRSELKTPAAFYLDNLTSWQWWSTGLTTTNTSCSSTSEYSPPATTPCIDSSQQHEQGGWSDFEWIL